MCGGVQGTFHFQGPMSEGRPRRVAPTCRVRGQTRLEAMSTHAHLHFPRKRLLHHHGNEPSINNDEQKHSPERWERTGKPMGPTQLTRASDAGRALPSHD